MQRRVVASFERTHPVREAIGASSFESIRRMILKRIDGPCELFLRASRR